MKPILLILWLFMSFFQLLGQDTEVRTQTYYLPLPGTNSIALSDWQFTLELYPQDGKATLVQITSLSYSGAAIHATGPRVFELPEKHGVLTWNFSLKTDSTKTRALRIDATAPLSGFLWAMGSKNQIIAVKLAESLSSSLFLPLIPESVREMTTSISLLGIHPEGLSSQLSFHYQDLLRGLQQEIKIRNTPSSTLESLVFTPMVTLGLDTLSQEATPSWGRVTADTQDYQLTGFQTFISKGTINSFPHQPAGINTSDAGMSSGWTLFSENSELTDRFVFTNPTSQAVDVLFQLVLQVPKEQAEQNSCFQEQHIVLQPRERKTLVIGQDLFPAIQPFRPTRMRFSSTSVLEAEAPVAIGAIHFQAGTRGELAASSFLTAGTEITTWLNLGQGFESALYLASAALPEQIIPSSDDSLAAQYVFPDVFGKYEIYDGLSLLASGPFVLNGKSIKAEISTVALREFYPNRISRPLLVKIKVDPGPNQLIARIDAKGTDDLASIEPNVTTPELAPSEEPGETPGEGEPAGE